MRVVIDDEKAKLVEVNAEHVTVQGPAGAAPVTMNAKERLLTKG